MENFALGKVETETNDNCELYRMEKRDKENKRKIGTKDICVVSKYFLFSIIRQGFQNFFHPTFFHTWSKTFGLRFQPIELSTKYEYIWEKSFFFELEESIRAISGVRERYGVKLTAKEPRVVDFHYLEKDSDGLDWMR